MAKNSAVRIDAIIFDYGEVLSEPADPIHMSNMARVAGLDEQRVKDLYWEFRDEYDRGTLHGETYWKAIADAAGTHLSPDQIQSLIDEDIASWSRVRAPMLAWQQELRAAGVKTAVLSNMMPDLLAHMRREFEWLTDFTYLTFSCEIGMVKPEEKIYRHVLEGLDVPPERALFLDDREVNIAGAQRAGMQGIVFKSLEDARERITALGLEF